MIRITFLLTSFSFLTVSPLLAEPEKAKSDDDKVWKNLLEGDNLSQWKKWRRGTIEDSVAWSLKDGVLHLSKAPEVKSKGGSITTVKHYHDFELKFDFKISPAGNSGVKYRSLDNLGFEFQVLDDETSKDNKNPLNKAASMYQLVAAPNDKKLNPAGKWNSARVVANGNLIEHWLNGEKVASVELGSKDWEERYNKSKYNKFPEFGKQGGEILLQDHGDEVWYRNLMIRELKLAGKKKTKSNKSEVKTEKKKKRASAELAVFTENCKACHFPETAVVGPSLVEISKLYPKGKHKEFIQWCLHPGKKRPEAPQMPAMAHVPEEQLKEIHSYILEVSKDKNIRVKSREDLYKNSPTAVARPRVTRTFLPNTGPASLLIALPTSEKHNLVWDTEQCSLDYISQGKVDNFPYLRSNGNSLSKPGDIIYFEQTLFLTEGGKRQFKGYHQTKEGYPTLHYTIGDTQIQETIAVDGNNIVRTIKAAPKLPELKHPKGNEKLDVKINTSNETIKLIYSPR